MRFALLGDHPDGLAMARALTASGRHELVVYSGPAVGMEYLTSWGLNPSRIGDLEEVLADPRVEGVIVAGGPAVRSTQLRRALQAERHVLCVHPADQSPDAAYEASMLQADAGVALLPLLPESFHPGVRALVERLRSIQPKPGADPALRQAIATEKTSLTSNPETKTPPLARNAFQVIELERWGAEDLHLDPDQEENRPGMPGWDLLRLLGGDIAEVVALADGAEIDPERAVVLSGRFLRGGLFQATLIPGQGDERLRLAVVDAAGRVELLFPQGWPGPAQLTYTDIHGQARTETWPASDPWPPLVEAFEFALACRAQGRLAPPGAEAKAESLVETGRLDWQDELRALELDDAARRSVERRRASALDYQEITEETGFKGAMTLVGCSLVWVSMVLLILSVWVPWLGWAILPVFGLFLVLQLLRWVVPQRPDGTADQPG